MKRNHLTGRRGRKRPPAWLYTVTKHDVRIHRLQRRIKGIKRKMKLNDRRILGVVHVGVTPWIEELKRIKAETGKNPLEGTHCVAFEMPDGTVHRAACEQCGTPAVTIRPERRSGAERREA